MFVCLMNGIYNLACSLSCTSVLVANALAGHPTHPQGAINRPLRPGHRFARRFMGTWPPISLHLCSGAGLTSGLQVA
jgi:hypothetical protein